MIACIDGTRHAQTTGQFCGQIGQNIAEHIGGDQDVVALRCTDNVRHHGIDNDFLDLHLRELLTNQTARIDEHAITEPQHVSFVHDSDVFSAGHREFESRTCDALAAEASDAA